MRAWALRGASGPRFFPIADRRAPVGRPVASSPQVGRAASLILLATLSLAALGGCGDDPEAEARAAVEAYVEALEAGDPDRVCSLLTQAELDDLEVSGSCRDVYTGGFKLLEDERVEIPDYEISNVIVDGDRGQVALAAETTAEIVPLQKEDGEWKLAGATSLDQIHPDDPLPGGPEGG